MNYFRLPLTGAYNVRELGGYADDNGTITRWHTFLRGDGLHALTAADIKLLKEYGLSAVIDLRSPQEAEMMPDVLASDDKLRYINIPLMPAEMNVAADLTKMEKLKEENFMAKSYVGIAELAKSKIKAIFDFIHECGDGCILFHCTAGKDRTGVLAALLLGLCGVSKADILANYQVTYTYIKENELLMQYANENNAEVLYSKMEYMEYFIEHIEKNYGGFEKYLLTTGISAETLETIRNRMVETV